MDLELYDLVRWRDLPDKPNTTDDPMRLSRWLGISHKTVSDMCYWFIIETVKLVSNTLVKHVARDDYLKPNINSSIDDLNKNWTEQLDDGNFQVNAGVDGKFDFILPDKHFRESLGVNYMITLLGLRMRIMITLFSKGYLTIRRRS